MNWQWLYSLSPPFVCFVSGVMYCPLRCGLLTLCKSLFLLGSPKKAFLCGKGVNAEQNMNTNLCCGRDFSFCRQRFIYVRAMHLQNSKRTWAMELSFVAVLLTQAHLPAVYFKRRGCIPWDLLFRSWVISLHLEFHGCLLWRLNVPKM